MADVVPNVRAVELLEAAGADMIGARFRTTFVGKLPFELRFDLRVSASGSTTMR